MYSENVIDISIDEEDRNDLAIFEMLKGTEFAVTAIRCVVQCLYTFFNLPFSEIQKFFEISERRKQKTVLKTATNARFRNATDMRVDARIGTGPKYNGTGTDMNRNFDRS